MKKPKPKLPKKVIITDQPEIFLRVVGGRYALPIIIPQGEGFRTANRKLKYSLGHLDK